MAAEDSNHVDPPSHSEFQTVESFSLLASGPGYFAANQSYPLLDLKMSVMRSGMEFMVHWSPV